MNVRQAPQPSTPGYPDHKEFQHYRHLLGAAMLGAGMAVSACNQKPDDSRPMGDFAVKPKQVAPQQQPQGDPVTPPNRTPGKPRVSPITVDPPYRTMGKIKVEPAMPEPPPRLQGDVMVMPKPEAPPAPGTPAPR